MFWCLTQPHEGDMVALNYCSAAALVPREHSPVGAAHQGQAVLEAVELLVSHGQPRHQNQVTQEKITPKMCHF